MRRNVLSLGHIRIILLLLLLMGIILITSKDELIVHNKGIVTTKEVFKRLNNNETVEQLEEGLINPSEICISDIIIDDSGIECTLAVDNGINKIHCRIKGSFFASYKASKSINSVI